MDLQIGNFLIAGISMLCAAGATIVAWVTMNRGAKKERNDTAEAEREERRKIELTLTKLISDFEAMDRAHNVMQGEVARDWERFDTAQGEQFQMLRDIQKTMAAFGTAVASNTATLQALKEQLQRKHDRDMHDK